MTRSSVVHRRRNLRPVDLVQISHFTFSGNFDSEQNTWFRITFFRPLRVANEPYMCATGNKMGFARLNEPAMSNDTQSHQPWNIGKLLGQRPPLKIKETWAVWVRLPLADIKRDLPLFNLVIDNTLRGSDLLQIKVSNIANAGAVASRAKALFADFSDIADETYHVVGVT